MEQHVINVACLSDGFMCWGKIASKNASKFHLYIIISVVLCCVILYCAVLSFVVLCSSPYVLFITLISSVWSGGLGMKIFHLYLCLPSIW